MKHPFNSSDAVLSIHAPHTSRFADCPDLPPLSFAVNFWVGFVELEACIVGVGDPSTYRLGSVAATRAPF